MRGLVLPPLLFFLPFLGQAQERAGVTADGRPYLVAVRTETPPPIDGRLDDPPWQRAARTDRFFQVEPVAGGKPSERTELFVLYDPDFLYLGIRCHDRDPEGIAATQMERDARLDPDDRVEIVLDTFHDHRFGYFFQINPVGGKGDALIGPASFSKAWDGIFYARASRDAGGWSAEFAIPMKTVRFRRGGTTWGLNVVRVIRRRNERIRWSDPSQDVRLFDLARAGELRGLEGLNPGLGLDVKPFLALRRGHDRPSRRRFHQAEPGGDVFLRIGEGTTAVLTANTDFADTEVDARQVNLTRFPLFFPEKRDFFLQDTTIFTFSNLGRFQAFLVPFFTRRMGLVGGREIPIRAGLKITGREGRLNFGLLDVQTGAKGDLDAENLLAARALLNVGEESGVGFLYTRGDPRSETTNQVLGLDATYRTSRFLGDKRFRAGVFFLKSWTGTRAGDDVAYGALLTYPNDIFSFRLNAMEIQENFDPRLGFVLRRGVRRYRGSVSYRPRPHTWIRQVGPRLTAEVFTNVGSRVETAEVAVSVLDAELESGDELELTLSRQFDRLPGPFEIHEGVVLPPGRYYWSRAGLRAETTEGRPWTLRAEISVGTFYSGRRTEYELGLVLRPSRHLTLVLQGELNDVDLPEGDFITRLYRLRARMYFTPELSLIHFLQFDNVSNTLGLQSRLRWNFRPGSDLFLVLNQGWDRRDRAFVPTRQRLTVKLEYTFRF